MLVVPDLPAMTPASNSAAAAGAILRRDAVPAGRRARGRPGGRSGMDALPFCHSGG